jgi:hypothetical protein
LDLEAARLGDLLQRQVLAGQQSARQRVAAVKAYAVVAQARKQVALDIAGQRIIGQFRAPTEDSEVDELTR